MGDDLVSIPSDRVSDIALKREPVLSSMSLCELATFCQMEIDQYRRGEQSTDGYTLELLYRALMQGDQDAREWILHCLRGLVVDWLHRHPNRSIACRQEREDTYIAQTFERFWQITTAQQLDFVHLSEALQYLRMSLNVVILDEVRTYSHRQEVFLQNPIEPAKPQREGNIESAEIWEFLITLLSNEREQRLAYLLFHCGLKPKEIVHLYPLEFDDMREISHIRCSIFKRFLDHVNGPSRLIPSAKPVTHQPGKSEEWGVKMHGRAL